MRSRLRRARVHERAVPIDVRDRSHVLRRRVRRYEDRRGELRRVRRRVRRERIVYERRVRMFDGHDALRGDVRRARRGSQQLRRVRQRVPVVCAALPIGRVRRELHRAVHDVRRQLRRHVRRSAPLRRVRDRVRVGSELPERRVRVPRVDVAL